MLMMMNGCATTEGRVIKAAELKGRAEARMDVPDLPAECRQHIERVKPKIGDKPRWIQARWEASADDADRRTDDCAAFHDDYKHRIEKR
jgi:hypothetical protein